MAKISVEQAKLELTTLEGAVASLTQSNVPVPQSLLAELERLKKVLAGNSSEQLANIFNSAFATKLNDQTNEAVAPLREGIIAAIGSGKGKIGIEVVTAEDGTKTLNFVATSGGGARGISSGNGGGDRGGSKYNDYTVEVLESPETEVYAEKTFHAGKQGGKQTLTFILNNGKNPMGFKAEYGDGASSNKTLETLSNNEVFKKHFKLEMKLVETPAATTAPAVKAEEVEDSNEA